MEAFTASLVAELYKLSGLLGAPPEVFEGYCRSEWGMTGDEARRRIEELLAEAERVFCRPNLRLV